MREQDTRYRCQLKKGFSLTELAIVMGVIGVLVTGVFLAYGSIHNRTLTNQTMDQLGVLTSNMQSLFAGRNSSVAALAPPATFTASAAVTATFINAGMFPTEMVVAGAGGSTAFDPWKGQVFVGPVAPAGSAVAQFVVEYTNIPSYGCTGLLTQTSAPGRETGLLQISLTSSANTVTKYLASLNQMPISAGQAVLVCTDAAAPYTIDWYYSISGGCSGGPC